MARHGLLLSRLEAIEALARTTHVVMDKTGTLTDTRLALAEQWPAVLAPGDAAAAFMLAAASHHPLSRALLLALQEQREQREALPAVASGTAAAASPSALAAQAFPVQGGPPQEHAGRGLEATDAQGHIWRLGASEWASAAPVPMAEPQLVLARDGQALAAWRFDEQLREDAAAAVADCHAAGLQVELLSGDRDTRVALAAHRAGFARWLGGATPEDKLDRVSRLQAAGAHVLMLGDGINDAPVLARAHASIAMGQGADLAKARADALLVAPRLTAVPQAVRLARRTVTVVRQNLGWALVYNAACVPMALVGWLPPWAAGLGMALSSCAVIANAARLGRS